MTVFAARSIDARYPELHIDWLSRWEVGSILVYDCRLGFISSVDVVVGGDLQQPFIPCMIIEGSQQDRCLLGRLTTRGRGQSRKASSRDLH